MKTPGMRIAWLPSRATAAATRLFRGIPLVGAILLGHFPATTLPTQAEDFFWDNGGAHTGNPSLTLSVPTVSITGDIAVGRANLAITSGTVTADWITTTAASFRWPG